MGGAIFYDFDMVPVMSGEKRAEFSARGIRDPRFEEKVALFRDPRAVAALRGADPEVREVFNAAGFSLGRSTRALPEGRFDAAEAVERAGVIGRLNDLVLSRRGALRGAGWNGFSLIGFIDAAEAACPMTIRRAKRPRPPATPRLVPEH